MAADKASQDPRSRAREPDALQQMLNRMQKRYEDMSFEDRLLRITREIKKKELSDADRRELLRRLG